MWVKHSEGNSFRREEAGGEEFPSSGDSKQDMQDVQVSRRESPPRFCQESLEMWSKDARLPASGWVGVQYIFFLSKNAVFIFIFIVYLGHVLYCF